MFITTTRDASMEIINYAQELAINLQIPYIERRHLSLSTLKQEHNSNMSLVVSRDKLILDLENTQLFFHPNMAQVRLKRLRSGGIDNMLEAMSVQSGMTILDCTLGFGADAIISAYGVGPTGKVIALESNPYIALITAEGLKNYRASNTDLSAAMHRIEVININYLEYLRQAPSKSVDIIYFDPMFRHTLSDSKNMDPLREIANYEPLSVQAIQEASRVARYRIVFKENAFSREFDRLGFTDIQGGKYSPIKYGVRSVV